MDDPYRDDLAYIHDASFGQMADAAGRVLVDALRRAGLDRGLVIDLGCGSGILSGIAIGAGYEVLGIDISPAMIAIARERVPSGQFRVASLLSCELAGCVGVAAVGECVNYLFDAGHSPTALEGLYRRIHDALAPGGLFLLDVAGPGRVPRSGRRRSSLEGDDWAILVESEEDPTARILTRRMTTFRRVGSLFRRDRETHRQRLIPRAEVEEDLHLAGFDVQILGEYGTLPFPGGLAGFLARKAGTPA